MREVFEAVAAWLIPLGCAMAGVGLVGRGLRPLVNTPGWLQWLKEPLQRLRGVFVRLAAGGAVCLFVSACILLGLRLR